jgi:stage II sporulation protein M
MMNKTILSLAVVLLAFVVSLVLGTMQPIEQSSQTLNELSGLLQPLRAILESPVLLVLIIFLNNSIKALASMAFGVALGIPTMIFVAVNGFTIGSLMIAIHQTEGWGFIAASLVPHGIIEVPMVLWASALGLIVGWEALKSLRNRPSAARATLRHGMKLYVRWILPGLFVAAVIEVLVTPAIASFFAG